MPDLPELTDLERDYLAEIFNVGVGNAASSLSQIVRQEIKLSVPEVLFLSYDELINTLGEKRLLSSVSQRMEGPFNAQSFLIFPDKGSFEIVRKMLGEQLSDESITELQNEAMSEIGNVVLNACIGSLSESLGCAFTIDLPDFVRNTAEGVLQNYKITEESLILFIRIELILSESKITGYLAFLLGLESFSVLREQLNKELNKFL